MQIHDTTAVLLIGHGRKAKDTPTELVEAYRKAKAALPMDHGQLETAENDLRRWPRTPENDPYLAGLGAMALALGSEMGGVRVAIAFNEFCSPSIEEAIEALAADGITEVVAMTTMITPGGNHSERDIPEALHRLGTEHPELSIRYVWPFPMASIARFLADAVSSSTSQIQSS